MNERVEALKGKLIVSCQALPHEPLHSSFIMGRMAVAAKEGGAVGIRANTKEDIAEIQSQVDLPIIGIVKRDYEDSKVYITPTMKEIEELMEVKPEIIAMDATGALRPGGVTLDDFFREVKEKYPDQLFMADCSNVEEGMKAAALGFDLIGTTMASYTPYTAGCSLPPYGMIKTLVHECGKPVVAEGNISTPEQLRHAMDIGVLTVVVGSAITRPLEITKRFVAALK